MGLVRRVYDRIGEITNEKNNHPGRQVFQRCLEKCAWFASQSEGNAGGNDHYWNAARAFFALRFLCERREGWPLPVQDIRDVRGVSDFRTKDPVGELDEEDKLILLLGLKYVRSCYMGEPAYPLWWTSRRRLVGLEEIYMVKEQSMPAAA